MPSPTAGRSHRGERYDPQWYTQRSRTEGEDLPRCPRRRAGDVPRLSVVLIRRLDETHYSAPNVRHICEIVRCIGRSDQSHALALRERSKADITKM